MLSPLCIKLIHGNSHKNQEYIFRVCKYILFLYKILNVAL